jgi:hypothetical protein
MRIYTFEVVFVDEQTTTVSGMTFREGIMRATVKAYDNAWTPRIYSIKNVETGAEMKDFDIVIK